MLSPQSGDHRDQGGGGTTPSDALGRYLREHYSAAAAGIELFQRSARSQTDPQVRRELAALAAEVAEDRAALLSIMVDLGVERSPAKERLTMLAERLGRLKTNGTVLRRSRLSDLLELEAMAAALHAKRLGWMCLRHLCDAEPRLNPYHLDLLVTRAAAQHDRVEEMRLQTAAEVLRDSSGSGQSS